MLTMIGLRRVIYRCYHLQWNKLQSSPFSYIPVPFLFGKSCFHFSTQNYGSKLTHHQFDLRKPAEEILANLSSTECKLLDLLKYEHQYLLTIHADIPPSLTPYDWVVLMMISSENGRLSYFRHVYMKLMDEMKSSTAKYTEDEIRDSSASLDRAYNSLLRGQKVVLDFSFEHVMPIEEIFSVIEQVKLTYRINKENLDPFHLVLANLDPQSLQYLMLHKALCDGNKEYPNLESLPFTISSLNYTDLYPDQELIYYTPKAVRKFCEDDWNHETIYIFGANISGIDKNPYAYAKAKKEGVKTIAFPLKKHLKTLASTDSLPLNILIQIMLTARDTNGDWSKALKLIPRYLTENTDAEEELQWLIDRI